MKHLIWLICLLMAFAGGCLDPAGGNPRGATSADPNRRHLRFIDLGDDEQLAFIWVKSLNLWVGRYEISNGQYQRFDHAHKPEPFFKKKLDEPELPAVDVTWEEAVNFCAWLNRNFKDQLPKKFESRLPTSGEWEAFVKCGTNRRFPWGDKWPPPNEYNYRGKEGSGIIYRIFEKDKSISGHNDGFVLACPVTRSGKNEWGLFGVGGNVWEWCQDWYDDEHMGRVIRGGSWNNYRPEIIAIGRVSEADPDSKNEQIGFRVVLSPIGASKIQAPGE